MGKLIEQKALEKGHEVVLLRSHWDLLPTVDVVVDFSHPDVVFENSSQVLSCGKPLIIGTTGWDAQIPLLKEIVLKLKGKILYSPNFSLGMHLFMHLVKKSAELTQNLSFQIPLQLHGLEMHHEKKVDSPSGTAKQLASLFTPSLPFTSLRLGSFPGTHSILIDFPYDTIQLTHEARSRECFAEGALTSAHWITEQTTTGWYTLDDMVRSFHSPHYPL
jgi:4-hydroxy-tetrahydrodipicolinate reductase